MSSPHRDKLPARAGVRGTTEFNVERTDDFWQTSNPRGPEYTVERDGVAACPTTVRWAMAMACHLQPLGRMPCVLNVAVMGVPPWKRRSPPRMLAGRHLGA